MGALICQYVAQVIEYLQSLPVLTPAQQATLAYLLTLWDQIGGACHRFLG